MPAEVPVCAEIALPTMQLALTKCGWSQRIACPGVLDVISVSPWCTGPITLHGTRPRNATATTCVPSHSLFIR